MTKREGERVGPNPLELEGEAGFRGVGGGDVDGDFASGVAEFKFAVVPDVATHENIQEIGYSIMQSPFGVNARVPVAFTQIGAPRRNCRHCWIGEIDGFDIADSRVY